MKFTDKEIALAKELKALGFPQEVKKGDWYHVTFSSGDEISFVMIDDKDQPKIIYALIPSLSACLEWLIEKGFFVELGNLYDGGWACFWKTSSKWEKGDTPLEACYAAIKAILEGEK